MSGCRASSREQGEELTSIFVNVFQATLNRQQDIEKYSGDICYCERCMDPTELGTNFGTCKCETCSGPVLPIDNENIFDTDWKCGGTCRKTFTSQEIACKVRCFVDEFRSLQCPKKPELQALEDFRTKVEKHLHSDNFFFMLTKMGFIHLCMTRIVYDLILDSELEESAEYCRDVLKVLLNPCLIDHSNDWIAKTLLSLSQINLEIMKRKVASKKMDSTGAELAKKYCSELKLLSTRFGSKDYSESDVESMQGNDIRLSPF